MLKKLDIMRDRAFRNRFFALLIPSVIQISISNFVNMLDDLMVGRLGTAELTGVSVSNQLLFIFNFTLFGVLSATGIFGAQFFGAKDYKGFRNVFRSKILFGSFILLVSLLTLGLFNTQLISIFLKGEGARALADNILLRAKDYLNIILIGLPAFMLTQCYSGSMRESGDMKRPMQASVIAVLSNLVGNYILIFGKFGLPALGVQGAAISTVISRFIELFYLARYAHAREYPYLKGVYRTLRVPMSLMKNVFVKGLPLAVNELLWSMSMTQINQILSMRSLIALAAVNITNTLGNLANVFMIGLSQTVAVFIGQRLGENEIDRAKDEAGSFILMAFLLQMVVGAVLLTVSRIFPNLYNVEAEVRLLATSFIITNAMISPFNGATLCSYYILRSGGRTMITFFTDSVYNWLVLIPVAYFLVKGTNLDIKLLYRMVYATMLIKCLISVSMVKKGIWARRIV